MSAPYDVAATTYLDAGFWPIPVLGKDVPVRGATGYEGTVTADKVGAWLSTDLVARARAGRGSRVDNIALRHRGTVAIDVDQGYGDKDGVSQLAVYAERAGLPALPATWSSTARGDDSGSRQYLYRIAEDIRLKTKPCPSVELCCWHHRFTACWPSRHPGTGTTYRWYLPGAEGVPPTWDSVADRIPSVGELAMLPDAWFRAILGSTPNADRTATTAATPELLETFRAGEPDPWVQEQIDRWSDESNHLGHDETKSALVSAFMLGREGHVGVRHLYELIVKRFTDYVTVARPQQAEREIKSLVDACARIAQQKRVGPVVIGRMPTVAELMAGANVHLDNHVTVSIPEGSANPAELDSWLDTFTANNRPDRLARHVDWMLADPPAKLPKHAERLVVESIAGNYPAESVVVAVAAAHQHFGITDPEAPHRLLSAVLGGVLAALTEVA